jgi:hypothetical protein
MGLNCGTGKIALKNAIKNFFSPNKIFKNIRIEGD